MGGSNEDFHDNSMAGAEIFISFRQEGTPFYKAVILINLDRGKHKREELKKLTGIKNNGQLSVELTSLTQERYISPARGKKNTRNFRILKKGRDLVELVKEKCGYSECLDQRDNPSKYHSYKNS